MSDSSPSLILSRWREAEQAATIGPWEVHTSGSIGIRLMSDEDDWPLALDLKRRPDAEFMAVARTAMPLLLTALEAVLKLHQPADRGTGAQCEGCATHVTFTRWPCPTVEAITAALTGEEKQ